MYAQRICFLGAAGTFDEAENAELKETQRWIFFEHWE